MTDATMYIPKEAIHKQDIIGGLKRLGLVKGDIVLVHSSLSSFGSVRGGADEVIDALLEVVGPEGTILVPTFAGKDTVFDPAVSETGLGAIPKAFWKRAAALRSRHPLASVAAIGPAAADLIRNHEKAKTAHGNDTPYHRLYEMNGKILLLGVDQDRSTFLHTAEALVRLPYLRTATACYLNGEGETVEGEWSYFPGPHRNFIGLEHKIEGEGLVRKTRIGSCVTRIMECRPLLDSLLRWLEGDPGIVLSGNPRLPDGIRQRAVLYKQKLARECFTVAADTRYAGRSIEQIIDNTLRFGIDHVVLSCIGNTAWPDIRKSRRKRYLEELAEAGFSVAAIKANWGTIESLAALLDEAQTSKLIVPSAFPKNDLQQLEPSVNLLIENVRIRGATVTALIDELDTDGRDARVAFDPLEFLCVGEKPFLGVFSRTAIRRHLGAMYIADGISTGERTALGEGLAEIPELMSMIRNRSFDGLLVLQGETPEHFINTGARFFEILEGLGRCPE